MQLASKVIKKTINSNFIKVYFKNLDIILYKYITDKQE